MTMHISTGARSSALDAGFGPMFDGGACVLVFRTGTRPASVNDAPVGTVVATLAVPSDSFAAAVAGVISKNGTWQDTSADATGTPTWARLQTGSDLGTTNTSDKRADFDAAVGSGDISLDGTITLGQQVTLASLDITQPA